MSISVGDEVIRDGESILIVTPKLLNAIEGRHLANLDVKRIHRCN